MTKFNIQELTHIRESMKYSLMNYKVEAVKYIDIEGYKEDTYYPTLAKYDEIFSKLSTMLKEAVDE